MNIIFFTQSNSLDVFNQIQKRLRDLVELDRVGYYVANKFHYKDFLKKNHQFEEENIIIKEWEIYKKARSYNPNKERLNHLDKNNLINLWTSYITDRRLSFGKNYAYKQSYAPHFSFDHFLSITDIAFKEIEKLFDDINPDVIITLYTATFGDCIGHQIAKIRGIRSLDLRLSRLKNNVMFVDGVNEPPRHIEKLYNDKEFYPKDSSLKEAKMYIERVREKNAIYDGALKAGNQNKNSFRRKKSFLFSFSKKIPKILSYIRRKYEDDPQNLNPFESYFYEN